MIRYDAYQCLYAPIITRHTEAKMMKWLDVVSIHLESSLHRDHMSVNTCPHGSPGCYLNIRIALIVSGTIDSTPLRRSTTRVLGHCGILGIRCNKKYSRGYVLTIESTIASRSLQLKLIIDGPLVLCLGLTALFEIGHFQSLFICFNHIAFTLSRVRSPFPLPLRIAG
jgi:hypothetical protein